MFRTLLRPHTPPSTLLPKPQLRTFITHQKGHDLSNPDGIRAQRKRNSVRNTVYLRPALVEGEVVPSKEDLPYDVRRLTASGRLPVYSKIQAQKGNVSVVLRRVHGDLEALANDLSTWIPKDKIVVKHGKNQLLLKGNYVNDMRDWLTARNF
ncbi:hypothetical protein HDV00_002562 [Rhizophlyctis rosea]|nr:hypothetical protein HDV00_002562 [Rhizophlyctis rosea]